MCVCLALRCGALFSNSYIVADRAVAHFVFVTLLLAWALKGLGARRRVEAQEARSKEEVRGGGREKDSLHGGGGTGSGDVVAVGTMLVLARACLGHVARSHDKGAGEGGSAVTAAAAVCNAVGGLVLLMLALVVPYCALVACTRGLCFSCSDSSALFALALLDTYAT